LNVYVRCENMYDIDEIHSEFSLLSTFVYYALFVRGVLDPWWWKVWGSNPTRA
jgi:hypothetical protein